MPVAPTSAIADHLAVVVQKRHILYVAGSRPKSRKKYRTFLYFGSNSTSSLNQLNQPADLSVSNTDFLKSTQLEGGGSDLPISNIDEKR